MGEDIGDKDKPQSCRRAKDVPPAPGVPAFWPTTEMGVDEDWLPSTRNRPPSSPWEEDGRLEEAD